jgi:rRNA maturation RNase YbeY
MNSAINFFTQDTVFVLRKKRSIRLWIRNTLINEKTTSGNINVILCDDSYLCNLNKIYLKHNSMTDIITFPMTDEDNMVSGDIYISIERVRENAKIFGQSTFPELTRVIIHGVLHLCGYGDKTPKEKSIMRRKEDFYLDKLSELL